MQYFLERDLLRKIEGILKKAEVIFLFLDYDGTLTPIRKKPELALLSPSVRKTLKILSSLPQMVLTIISGRSLNQIHELVKLDSLNYAGNHGLEMRTNTYRDEIPDAQKIRKQIYYTCQKISKKIQSHSGVLIENKGLTATIHYRLANPKVLPELKKAVSTVLLSLKGKYEIREGKKVFEIRPKTSRNKGWAVNRIINLYNPFKKLSPQYLYLGDDMTDEDAFKLINSKEGYSIFIGKENNSSKANYYLKNPQEVHFFLIWIQEKLSGII